MNDGYQSLLFLFPCPPLSVFSLYFYAYVSYVHLPCWLFESGYWFSSFHSKNPSILCGLQIAWLRFGVVWNLSIPSAIVCPIVLFIYMIVCKHCIGNGNGRPDFSSSLSYLLFPSPHFPSFLISFPSFVSILVKDLCFPSKSSRFMRDESQKWRWNATS